MSRFLISTRCECQAALSATLDEHRHVTAGWAARGRSATAEGGKELAPAHSINAHLDRFDVAWLCPYCGRNTLRTFYAGAMRPLSASDAAAAAAFGASSTASSP
ncbi:uncharacterized protein SOCE26_047470 [Sorangium cellulosum]|uniref:Uncharacterized protein n=1 Tax=Sorangium cellulosum TaxID=56 RepID=A0A2L0EVK1_SORCE|nr:hypothetical protein [Sorangium cellulosum]AUX43302.1 uncharacterized protein SOCE26_047470 [Sorangium cellulosum]